MNRTLTDHWTLGGVRIPNRVVLAPLAGIGNWFVRLQAKRYGAGLVVSEMVSSFAVHYRNERTCRELLRIHPDEHPVSVQLFGHDPDVMASAAERVAERGRRPDRPEHGLPGAEGLQDRRRGGVARGPGARRGARARRRRGQRAAGDGQAAPGCGRAMTAASRSRGRWRRGLRRRALRSTPATPPSATRASPTTSSRAAGGGAAGPGADLRRAADAPTRARGVRADGRGGGAARPRLAGQPVAVRGAARARAAEPDARRDPRRARLGDRARREHLGRRARARYLRKFYPWYVERLAPPPALANSCRRRFRPRRASRQRALCCTTRTPPRSPPRRPAALGEPARAPPTPL